MHPAPGHRPTAIVFRHSSVTTIEVAAGPLLPWAPLLSGAAIGRKRIHLFTAPVPAGATLRLRVTHAIATPRLQGFGAFAPCPDN